MNKPFDTCCRISLVAILTVALIATSSLAGVAPAVHNCDAECCQPRNHYGTGMAKVKLSAVQPMSGCTGMQGSHCDLQPQADAKRSHQFQAVQPSSRGSLTSVPTAQVSRKFSSHAAIDRPPAHMTPQDTTPIFIGLQSILI